MNENIERPENYKKLKTEFNRKAFKKELKEKLGNECCNCGSKQYIEYHHIVPLIFGGTNKISNIVPLCASCHKCVHNASLVRQVKSYNKGRHRKELPKNYEKILWDYLKGKIGRKECHNLLKLGENTKMTDSAFFKEFLKSNNIKTYKNRVDLLTQKRADIRNHKGETLSEIVFKDGLTEKHYVGEYDDLWESKKKNNGTVLPIEEYLLVKNNNNPLDKISNAL